MNVSQRRDFVSRTRSQLGYAEIGSGALFGGVDQSPRPQVILITDPGKDLDDEQAMVLAAGLHHAEIINLVAVVANLDPALDRAKLARGTLDLLELFSVRVGIGTPVFVGGKTEKHECDADYANAVLPTNLHPFFVDPEGLLTRLTTPQLLRAILKVAGPKSLTWVLNSGLTDAALCFLSDPTLFVEKTKEVVIMGGVQNGVFAAGPDKVQYLTPDTAANNAYDWPSALFLYQALQELKVPMCVVMRWMPYACQFPFSLYDKFAATGNPIGANLLRRQAPSINLLWKAANVTQEEMADPARAAIRGKLPMDRNRQWFVNVFCKGVDPGIGPTEEVWSYVGDYNQYDALALAMVVPEIRSRYTIPVQVEVKGVQHQIIGIAKEQPGLKDGDGLRNLISEIEIGALSWKE